MKLKDYAALILIAASASCNDSQFPDYELADSGLYYIINESGEGGKKVMINDIITIDLVYSAGDSILYDSKTVPFETQLKVVEPAYKGDIMEGFAMMSVGDVAFFKTSADSFFTRIANQPLPPFIDSGSFMTFEVKVVKAQTYDELMAERKKLSDENAVKEGGLIEAYIKENSISAKPTETGMYYIETLKGSGKKAERGNTVVVHYIGRLLSGEKFDASYDRNEPFEFTLGAGQVIPGWDEGIGYMTVGSKATFIIPSNLAYGDSPPPGGVIKPFSTLVFEVELVDAR